MTNVNDTQNTVADARDARQCRFVDLMEEQVAAHVLALPNIEVEALDGVELLRKGRHGMRMTGEVTRGVAQAATYDTDEPTITLEIHGVGFVGTKADDDPDLDITATLRILERRADHKWREVRGIRLNVNEHGVRVARGGTTGDLDGLAAEAELLRLGQILGRAMMRAYEGTIIRNAQRVG